MFINTLLIRLLGALQMDAGYRFLVDRTDSVNTNVNGRFEGDTNKKGVNGVRTRTTRTWPIVLLLWFFLTNSADFRLVTKVRLPAVSGKQFSLKSMDLSALASKRNANNV